MLCSIILWFFSVARYKQNINNHFLSCRTIKLELTLATPCWVAVILSTLHTLIHLILTKIVVGFANKKTKTQKGSLTCPESQRKMIDRFWIQGYQNPQPVAFKHKTISPCLSEYVFPKSGNLYLSMEISAKKKSGE